MKMYEYVIVPPSPYRKEPSPGIYIGKRPRSQAKEEMILMRDKNDPTTFVLRLMRESEFKIVYDTGFNAENQIKDINVWFEKAMRMYKDAMIEEKEDDQLRGINKELYQANQILENQNKNRQLYKEWIWDGELNNSTNMEDDLK